MKKEHDPLWPQSRSRSNKVIAAVAASLFSLGVPTDAVTHNGDEPHAVRAPLVDTSEFDALYSQVFTLNMSTLNYAYEHVSEYAASHPESAEYFIDEYNQDNLVVRAPANDGTGFYVFTLLYEVRGGYVNKPTIYAITVVSPDEQSLGLHNIDGGNWVEKTSDQDGEDSRGITMDLPASQEIAEYLKATMSNSIIEHQQ